MANGNGANGVGKPRGVSIQVTPKGDQVIEFGWLAKLVIGSIALPLLVGQARLTYVQMRDHDRQEATQKDLELHKRQSAEDHAKMVKIDEFSWRVGNWLVERDLYSPLVDLSKRGRMNGEPAHPIR